MERNRQLLNALKMEKAVTVVTIGLIELVAALNILITLVMMVMEKYRDIAVLMSMGARRAQIRRIFMLQGVLIGVVGTAIGLVVGYGLCYFADRYRWIRLDEQVYALSFVPFEPRWVDGLWIAGGGDPGELPGDHLSGAERHADCAGGSAAVRIARAECHARRQAYAAFLKQPPAECE
jgi:ABC-type lipoprotein release transport system permease subunit